MHEINEPPGWHDSDALTPAEVSAMATNARPRLNSCDFFPVDNLVMACKEGGGNTVAECQDEEIAAIVSEALGAFYAEKAEPIAWRWKWKSAVGVPYWRFQPESPDDMDLRLKDFEPLFYAPPTSERAEVVAWPSEDDIAQLLFSVQRGSASIRPTAAKIIGLFSAPSPVKMLVDQAWLDKHVATDPDCCVEGAPDPAQQVEPPRECYAAAEEYDRAVSKPPEADQFAQIANCSETPAVAEGWKLVPVEPTALMLARFEGQCFLNQCPRRDELRAAYNAMLAAAPNPENQGHGGAS